METPGPYVWPVKKQRVAARRSIVLSGGPKRPAASLSLADCGRGAGRFPTRGGGVGRSSSRGRKENGGLKFDISKPPLGYWLFCFGAQIFSRRNNVFSFTVEQRLVCINFLRFLQYPFY